jgi:hypothetical protein
METESEPDTYVTHAGWLRTAGRVDLIDEVADSFERPTPPSSPSFSAWPDGRGNFWAGASHRWPRATSAMRSAGLLHPRATERRAS